MQISFARRDRAAKNLPPPVSLVRELAISAELIRYHRKLWLTPDSKTIIAALRPTARISAPLKASHVRTAVGSWNATA